MNAQDRARPGVAAIAAAVLTVAAHVAVVATLAAVTTTACKQEEQPAGKILLYAFPFVPPDPAASADTVAEAAKTAESVARRTEEVVSRRLQAMGWTRAKVERNGSRDLRIRLPADLAAEIPLLRAVVERSGTLEFRLRARPNVELACAPMQPEDYPAGLKRVAWSAADESDHPPYVVVEVPEDLPADPAHPADRQVFVADDLASLEAVEEDGGNVLRFEMRPERRSAFTDFTTRNLERAVVILIDGSVVSAPVIKSPLPGNGVIARDGSGFSKSEARFLAALLGNGQLPCRLRFVAEE